MMTIKEFRISQKLSQVELATALGISVSSERAYEYGVRNPSVTFFARIKELYGVDLAAAEAAPAPAVEEAPAKKPRTRKKKETAAEAAPAEPVPAVEEKAEKPAKRTRKKKDAEAAPAEPVPAVEEKVDEKPAKKLRARKKTTPTVIIQSIMGGEINVEQIIAKVGEVDTIYVKPEENAAFWVRGEETGAVSLW
jgi:transcriptional regulator with XRE-family HTH domain